MAAVTAAQVKALREETGLPMMECKAALTEAEGNTEQAKILLQKKYKGKMAGRAANVTGEGRVALFFSEDKKVGAIADVRCETAPVAKTEQFVELAENIARTIADQDESKPAVEAIVALPSAANKGKTVADDIADVFGILRENMKLSGACKLEGEFVCGYVHHDGKSGVLISLDAVPNPESIATDLCHHVIFANPMAIDRDGISAEEIEKVGHLAREIATSEGKPEKIVDKIVEGKVNAFCAQNALMEQEHVKVSKTTVRDVLAGGHVKAVVDFAVFKIGA